MSPTSSDQTLAQGKYLSLVIKEGYEFVERVNCSGVVVIFAITDTDHLVLVEQYRPPHRKNVLELPAGLVNDLPEHKKNPERHEVAARRELLEETGYEAEQLEYLAQWPTTAGMSSEVVDVYYATGLKKAGLGGGVDGEAITLREFPLENISAALAEYAKNNDVMIDPKIYAALFLYCAKVKSCAL